MIITAIKELIAAAIFRPITKSADFWTVFGTETHFLEKLSNQEQKHLFFSFLVFYSEFSIAKRKAFDDRAFTGK